MFKEHPLFIFRDFRNLFAARVISAVGDKFFQIALVWWALGEGKNGKFNVGLIMAVNVLPIVIFGPLLGAFVDKANKKKAMLFADFARALLVLALFAFLSLDRLNLYAALGLVFLLSAFGPMFESSVASSLFRLTSKDHLSQATAVDSSSIQLSSVFGAALGSILITAIGIKGAFFFNSITYLLSFLFVLMITTDLKPEAAADGSSFSRDLREGFNYLVSDKPVLYLVLFFSFLNFFVAPIFILIPMIVKFTLLEDVKWLAIFETFFALGLTLVSILLGFKKGYKNPYKSLFLSILFAGAAFLSLAFSGNKYFSLFLLTFMGAAISLGNVVILSVFQNTVKEEMKGRFFSLITTVAYAVTPISFMVNGVLAEKTSVEFSVCFNGAFTIFLSFVILFMPKIGIKDKKPEAAAA